MTPVLSIAAGLLVVVIGILVYPDPVGYRRFRVDIKMEERHE